MLDVFVALENITRAGARNRGGIDVFAVAECHFARFVAKEHAHAV